MKIFYKKRFDNGVRDIYFCGIKVFTYRKKVSKKLSKHLNYKTYQDLICDIKANIHKIPSDIDLIVGIPRSGMIPAYMLALALNKQVCSLNEFVNGIYGTNGITRKIHTSRTIRKVLVIDDSVHSGESMSLVKNKLKALSNKYEFIYSAVYISAMAPNDIVDIPMVYLPQPRVFQWNYIHHSIVKHAAFDIDGVLCIDPTNEENDDGEKYKNFILNARPLYIPKYKIAAIVTSRLEKYRPQTEKWLKSHNIEYDELYMLKNMTAEQRRAKCVHAKHKGQIYKKLTNCAIFIESDDKQAREIAKTTHKQVFCSANDRLY